RYHLRLGVLGFRRSRRPRGPDGARDGRRTEVADQGGDARGDRGLPVVARATRDPGRHLDLLHPWWLLGGRGRGWAFILPNFIIVAALGALYVHWAASPRRRRSSTG